jgi:dienelactone hydrolase
MRNGLRSGVRAVALGFLVVTLGGATVTGATTAPAKSVPAATAPKTTIEVAAESLVTRLAAGDFKGATSRFDGQMRETLPPDKLAAVWEGLRSHAGPFEAIEGTRTEVKAEYRIVYVACKFAALPIDTKVAFDASDRIAGLFFTPRVKPSEPPPYAARDRFEERNITVRSGRWQLPGQVTIPRGKGPFPAVVLVQGSGPHDADETIGPNKPFRDLAWGLASRGVVVLRYTKRTLLMAQQETASVAGLTVESEVLEDARAALDLAARTSGVDSTRLFVIGHSLGGMLAPRLAQSSRKLAGIAILAGNVTPLEDLALEQVRWMADRDGNIDAAEKATITAAEKAVAAIHDPALRDTTTVTFLGAPIPGSYWLDLRNYRPEQVAAALPMAVQVLQGDRDYQVGRRDFEAWKQALAGKRDAACKLYPGLNHLFMAVAGEPGPEQYATPGHVAEVVVGDLATWITATAKR